MSFHAVLPMFLACTGDSGSSGDSGVVQDAFPVDIAVSEVIPTVPTVTWSAEDVDSAVVHYGLSGELDHSVTIDVSGSPPYQTQVLGMKPDREYTVRVEAMATDGSVLYSEQGTVTTGSAPSDLPNIQVEAVADQDPTRQYYVTSLMGQATAVILDADGEIVWWYPVEEYNMLGRVRLSVDGQSVLMADINLYFESESEILRVSLDGSQVERIDTPLRHHDFVEHPDGTLAWMSADPQTVDGVAISGDRLVERSPDGTLTTIYDILDHHEAGAASLPGTGDDWPHANAIDLVPDQDGDGWDYLVSFLHMGGLARIDRATGAEEWFVGGGESTLLLPNGSPFQLDHAHGMHLSGDRLLVFENGTGTNPSSAVELALDLDQDQVTEVWRYSPEPSLQSPVFGDVLRYDSGHTLVTFSYNGVIHELDADGELLWSMSADLGGAFCYVTPLDDLQP